MGNISNLPEMDLYVTLAVAHMALAGPSLYFFWKQRRMRQYCQLSMGIPSPCCTGMVLLMGMSTQFAGPFFAYTAIKDTDRDEISETAFANMRAPYSKPYSVTLNPKYTLYPLTGSVCYNMDPLPKFTGEETPSTAIHYGDEGTRVRSSNVGMFSSKFFMMKYRMESEQQEGLIGDVSSFDGKVTGTLANSHGQETDSAAILLYNQMILIGHMEPGETVSLDGVKIAYGITSFGYTMAEQITGASCYKEDKDMWDAAYVQALERTNLLSFYMGNYLSGYHSEARILGFSNEKEETGLLKFSSCETYGSTLLTPPIDVNYERDGMIYKSALRKQPNVLSGEYHMSNNSMYGLTPVMLEYYLGNDIEVERLSFYQISDEVVRSMRYYYMIPFAGNIYFHSYNTGTYDSMNTHVQPYDRGMLEPYLSPGNALAVEYVCDATGDCTWNIMLPMLTVTGGSK